jgi:hypothetical protein
MAEVVRTRDRRKAETPPDRRASVAAFKNKKWSELTTQQKDKILGQVAFELGFVLPES